MTPLSDELQAERKQLRTKLRQKRRNLSPAQQFRAAQRATIRFARHPWYRAAKTLAVYWPNDGELSPLLLMHLALKQGKICCFPSIRADGQLLFKVYFNGAKTHKNRYGIPELNSMAKLCIADLDLMLMPLVGFDSRGNRLGMGGGFYDKTLGSLLGRKRGKAGAQRLKTVGWAHSLQKVEGLHSAKWDIPLRAIATDTELKVTRF